MPNVQKFLQLDSFELNSKPAPLPKIEDIKLPRNQWYFHHGDTDSTAHAEPEAASTMPGESHEENTPNSSRISWQTLVTFFVVIDVLWFVSRIARAFLTAKLMLYGIPLFIDAEKPG